jgi:electron transport complex protein RnfG
MNMEGKLSGVKILSQKETPGLGTKLAEPSFLEPFMRLVESNPQPNFRVKQDSGDVDAITAATISSRAFCAGVRQGNELFAAIKDKLQEIKPPTVQTETTQQGEAK